jgi:hypothetical protein
VSVTRGLQRAKDRYDRIKDEARLAANIALRPHYGDFRLDRWTAKAREAYDQQWTHRHPDSAQWDWHEIFRRHRDPECLDVVLWAGEDRLAAIALALVGAVAVELRFLEGDYRADCPLRGRRVPIILECAANYAQGLGKHARRPIYKGLWF